jgi:hypothetical protein
MTQPLAARGPRVLAVAVTVLASAVVAAPSASGASKSLLNKRVSAADAQKRRCHSRLVRDDSVVRRSVRVRRPSLIRARLNARSGDWDVAIFQARDRRRVGGSAGFRSVELAEGFADAGRVIVQACRRKGRSRRARLRVSALALRQRTGQKREVTRLVSVSTPNRAEKQRLLRLGLDVTEHGDSGHLDVVLHGARDANRLRSAGFDYEVEIPDLALRDFRNRQRNARYAQETQRTSLPSGRDTYRRLPDFQADMKRLVERRPDLVKPITLPNRTLEGRPVTGVEITENVRARDGKPVFFQMGVHHAREWPSAEMPMEFALELVNGYGRNARITRLVRQVRTIVVPVINPDGYNLSREASIDLQPIGSADPYSAALSNLLLSPTGIYEPDSAMGLGPTAEQVVTNPGHTAAILADGEIDFAYKRRNCRIADGRRPAAGQCAMQENRHLGVDPNRNYGGFWGGPGASAAPDDDTYRGAAPFSEPEVDNVRKVVSSRQVTALITNHTFSNLVLRPPGIAEEGRTPDETIYKALGDAMGRANGYASQYGYELYDTTGTTEDWSYYQSGGLGFTFEIGPNEFHPPYEQVVAEYEGNPSTPVDRPPFRAEKHGGNREAYLLAMESAANAGHHSVLTGRAPAGTRVQVTRSSNFLTSSVIDAEGNIGQPRTLSDIMTSSTTVPSSGRLTWHVNPSTRPYAMKNRLQYEAADSPTSRQNIAGGPATQRIPITIGAQDKALRAFVDVGDASDYDLYLYDSKGTQVASGTPAGFVGEDETVSVTGLPPGTYQLEVRNFAAVEPWTGVIEKFPAKRVFGSPARTETWKLTCRNSAGRVIGGRNVAVRRGQRLDLGRVCGRASAGVLRAATPLSRRGLRVSLFARRVSLRTLLRRGMRVRVRCHRRACTARVRLQVANRTARRLGLTRRRRGRVTIASRRIRRLGAGRARTVRLKLTRRARRALRGRRAVRLRLTVASRTLRRPRQVRRIGVSFTARR